MVNLTIKEFLTSTIYDDMEPICYRTLVNKFNISPGKAQRYLSVMLHSDLSLNAWLFVQGKVNQELAFAYCQNLQQLEDIQIERVFVHALSKNPISKSTLNNILNREKCSIKNIIVKGINKKDPFANAIVLDSTQPIKEKQKESKLETSKAEPLKKPVVPNSNTKQQNAVRQKSEPKPKKQKSVIGRKSMIVESSDEDEEDEETKDRNLTSMEVDDPLEQPTNDTSEHKAPVQEEVLKENPDGTRLVRKAIKEPVTFTDANGYMHTEYQEHVVEQIEEAPKKSANAQPAKKMASGKNTKETKRQSSIKSFFKPKQK
ncbi:hypothetical protein O9G_001422 [Rozella allomycis CSF55]|uniref:DNA polymerase delta subunit 3 n=1 Tax=Rozella allomycis (strain CSF55) TaxID=988480 RepID=A0A075B3K3_ROZAC|nr:hypothetical protein O9G_001422 [Rozella allomycis CSF55]|eukprot:EPZ36977.1 hypothetical protein O9G_001422 [Rozella allomycis CSF55]